MTVLNTLMLSVLDRRREIGGLLGLGSVPPAVRAARLNIVEAVSVD